MIDWWSDETHLLLNDAMPDEERVRLETLVRRLPQRNAHVWMATSGTTSGLRLVALPKKAFVASASAVNRILDATMEDSWCCVLPIFHVGGLSIFARAAVLGSRVVRATWNASTFATLCRENRIAFTSLVPAQMVDLLRANVAAPESLRAVIIGGGVLDSEVYGQARRLGWPVRPSYGMTETASQVATAAPDREDLLLLPHVEARVENDGRLSFRGPSLFSGYAYYDEKGEPAFTDPKVDGWFTSDDAGRIDGNIVRVLGRSADFVKIGGESVHLSRLDAILEEVRASDLNAALVALPDDRLGHAVHLAVASGYPDEVIDAFNRRVLPFERIRGVHRVPEIPRSALGKLMRAKLAELVS